LQPAPSTKRACCAANSATFQTTTSSKEELAKAALMMASILPAAGVFTGVMQGSGMLKAMAQTVVIFVSVGLLGASVVMTTACVLFGIFPL